MAKCRECNKEFGFFELNGGKCKSCLSNLKSNCLSCGKEFNKNLLIKNLCGACTSTKQNIKFENRQKILVKNYIGNNETATKSFQKDSKEMDKKGYHPISQNYTPGSYGCGSFILALILCVILIGFLVFVYMLIVKPDGTLSVTYELKNEHIKNEEIKVEKDSEKECPQCAEIIKKRAKICRFCRYEFKN